MYLTPQRCSLQRLRNSTTHRPQIGGVCWKVHQNVSQAQTGTASNPRKPNTLAADSPRLARNNTHNCPTTAAAATSNLHLATATTTGNPATAATATADSNEHTSRTRAANSYCHRLEHRDHQLHRAYHNTTARAKNVTRDANNKPTVNLCT